MDDFEHPILRHGRYRLLALSRQPRYSPDGIRAYAVTNLAGDRLREADPKLLDDYPPSQYIAALDAVDGYAPYREMGAARATAREIATRAAAVRHEQ